MANEKSNKFGIVLSVIIAVLGLASAICGFTMDLFTIIRSVVSIIIYALILYYLFVDYKKPHGNLFRIVMAIYPYMFLCLCLVIATEPGIGTVDVVFATLYGIAAVAAGYSSGRLNKVKSSSFIMMFVAIFLMVDGVYALRLFENPIEQFASININLQWLLLLLTYNVRFREHTEAGKE